MNTQNSAPNTNSFASTNAKYGGLVKKKAIKRLRNYLFLLIGYIDTISPHFLTMHTVVMFFRIMQLIGPALYVASERFFTMGSLEQKFVSYFSVLFHIVPVEYRFKATIYIEIIYFLITLIYFITLITSALVYKTTSKLPKKLISAFSAVDRSVMFLIHPIALQMASQDVSRLIMGIETYTSTNIAIGGAVITYFCTFIYAFTYAKTMSLTFSFRPNSLLTTSHIPQLYLMNATYLSTVISGLATYLSKIPCIVLVLLTSAVSVFGSMTVFMPASFVRTLDMRLVFSTGMAGGLLSFIVAVYAIIDKKATMILLFIGIGLFTMVMVISFPLIDHYEKKSLRKLDGLVDDFNAADHYKKPSHLIRDACIGMKYAHPVCIDWSIFKAGSEIWSNSSEIWAIFGKFVAIYPEENSLLSYIIRSIETKKLKGNFAKQTIAQGKTILAQRETSLCSELKKKMQHVGKTVQASKRKLRHIWDIVIQGNTHEMETSVNNAYKTIVKTEAEFNHVLVQYPNNRFIARSYARFLQEIKADLKGFQEWVEKVKILQRGLPAFPDNTNIIGMLAFPNLPPFLTVKNDGGAIQVSGETESAFQLEVDIEDDQVSEQMSGIKDQISDLTIPSLSFVSIMSVVNFLIFMVALVVAFYMYAKSYIHSLNTPLEFMYYLSYLRTLTNQLPSFSFRSIFEEYPKNNPLFRKLDYSDIELDSLGHHYDSKSQYKYLIKELTVNLEALGKYRSYKVDNPILAQVENITFKSILPYQFYTNNGSHSEVLVSIQSGLMDFSIQLSKLGSLEEIDESTLISSIVMNPLVNTEKIGDSCSLCILRITDYLESVKKDMDKIMLIIFIVLIVFFIVYYTLITYLQISKINANKNEIYSCLTSLPKNVVSSLAEALRILKKDSEGTRTTEQDTEFSKQEDNIIKVFATCGDDQISISSDRYAFILCNFLMLVIEIVLTLLLTEMFKKVNRKLVVNGPHLNYVFGSIAYMMEAMNIVNLAAVSGTNYFNYTSSLPLFLTKLKGSNEYFQYYYQHARYGGNSTLDTPFAYFKEVNNKAIEKYSCEDSMALPITYKDIYSCFNPDHQTTLFIGLVSKIALPVVYGKLSKINLSDPMIDDLWFISAILLYQSFFHPMFESILPQLEKTIDSAIPDTFPTCIGLLIVAFFFVIVINVFVSIVETKLKFALSLLLHVQLSIIMQTQKIVDVLNGHFSSRSKDSKTRNQRFFTEVVSSLPDSIIIINNQMEIISANKSTERIYSIAESELIGTKINDFLSSKNFSDDMSSLVNNATSVAAAVNTTSAQYKKGTGSSNHLELSCITFNQFFVLTTRDVTRMFVYNTLIEEERAKSDKLLASILPPSLVVRVQRGEKNISFAVQSATILFLDIVSFTPWCASNTAAVVMQTLNTLFKLLDNKLATHQTATKIKCIGDCYMCAGGIFDVVNQPNVHAKEIVEFGQESIECVRQLDKENDLSLQIRVGINTGGPIVAGVLGTEKPTFEILGPAINMAQQMEHHGVPMLVHISRSVYELVYGGAFIIKERGQVEIKSGKVITYLVYDKNSAS